MTSRPETSGSWMSMRISAGRCCARELESFEPVAGLDRRVAVRSEKIVEELHVELVVLHDQNGLAPEPRLGRALVPGAAGLVKFMALQLALP